MVLTFEQFSKANRARCEHPEGFQKPIGAWSRSDWLTALLGELGEAANVAKKLNRVRDGIPGNTVGEAELREQFGDELADTFIYLDLLAQSEGFSLAELVIRKFDATSRKIGYPARIGGPARALPHTNDGEG